jgi:hypothetical protein
MNFILKDPQAELDYGFDWGSWLDGDTIADSIWIADSGITVESDVFTDTTTTVWLSGGTLGCAYNVTNRITTAAGRTDDRTLLVQVSNR